MKTINFKETEKIEFKQSTSELKQALVDICAFANKGEGIIYFGVKDDGTVIGQEVSDNTIQRVVTTILTSIEPRIFPNVYSEIFGNKTVLIIDIKNAPEKPYFYKGKAYKRVGTSNAYLSRYEIEKYLYERENPIYRFDKTTLSEYTGGINNITFKWFVKQVKEKRNISDEQLSKSIILNNIGAYTNKALNIGGILTFGNNIQKYLSNAIIKCAVFESIDKTGKILDHIEIKDNVFKAIDLTERFILRNLRKIAWINEKTGRREEKYEIPYLAIREAVANAVAHRDYKSMGNIDIALFDDRIEIWSPGLLPAEVSLKTIRSGRSFSVPRNPIISEALFLTGYIEKWGTGINKMNLLMKQQNLPKPLYEEYSGAFVVTFKKKKNNESQIVKLGRSWEEVGKKLVISKINNLSKTENYVLENIYKNNYITIKELSEILNISTTAVDNNIKKLKNKNIIKRVGSKKGGYWQVILKE